ncbi:bile acid:sodium symporter family protein [Mariniflexile sp. HNIBRBA6329]|uniref:bile acid:sodium symporter family protein n=1 Tax=Mariniflexile sp. HNIBRBA6329 TaxID=3373088 RepID=UPI003746E382
MKIKLDGFVLAIIAIVITAYFFPNWGSKNSPVPLNLIGSIGVSLIFFFYGLKLSPEKIKTGLKNWKLHLLVQASTFILFPIIVMGFYPLIANENDHTIWLAFMFLAALPSTVSSSVVMVSIAKGNIPAAIFNASISGLIGIIVTPLWIGLFLQKTSTHFDLGNIYLKLLTEILLPVIIGISLQRYLGDFVRKNLKYLTLFDKAIILLIIYKSFAESFLEHVFNSVNIADLLFIFIAIIALFFVVFFLIKQIAMYLNFSLEDRITAQFCGTKKSLVHGTVFSKILFQNTVSVGVILLPLMLFHFIQIFIISIIASKMNKNDAL